MALLIANASRSLANHIDTVRSAYEQAVKIAKEQLDLTEFDVVCVDEESMCIPEIGVGGYTPNNHLVYLYINPLVEIDGAEVFNTLCHELNHAKRYYGPGYGATLFDSIIFEGVAVAFELQVANNKPFLPTHLSARTDTENLIATIKSHFADTDFDHFTWFIHDKTGTLPRWTGYEVGYYLVRQYLKNHPDKKASDLVLEPSSIFTT